MTPAHDNRPGHRLHHGSRSAPLLHRAPQVLEAASHNASVGTLEPLLEPFPLRASFTPGGYGEWLAEGAPPAPPAAPPLGPPVMQLVDSALYPALVEDGAGEGGPWPQSPPCLPPEMTLFSFFFFFFFFWPLSADRPSSACRCRAG